MRRLMIMFVALLAFGFSVRPCSAAGDPAIAEQPPLGTFKMRPELVGQHPRLYFTKEDIPAIRARANGPSRFFLEAMKRAFGPYVGQDVPADMPAWKRYVYGFWGLTSLDILYVATGEQRYADTAKKWAMWLVSDHWWVRSNLAHMDALSGLAVTYDVLYDQFTEAERQAIRQSIYEGVDFISQRFFEPSYWTRDYQNNHMHNRLHGLANGAFAIYGDDPDLDVQKQADLAIAQILNVARWLPEDGSQHEGPGYWTFGHNWVARFVHLAEHVTGMDIVGMNPHFTNAHYFRIYMTTPGWKTKFGIGDTKEGFGAGALSSLCRSIAEAEDPWATSVLHEWMEMYPDGFYRFPGWGLLWYDPTIQPRPVSELPLYRFWPDLEMFSIRSSWDDEAAGFAFKCGPPGGHKMQQLRGDRWVNVAHDHPDQNHFLLFAHGKMMAQDDGYPKPKLTQSHNTLVIDGKGQPEEGGDWQQPFPYEQTGTLRDVFLAGSEAYAAGDASRLYEGVDEFVRHVFFPDGDYLVVLDELVGSGDGEHDYEWRLHKDGEWKRHGPGHFAVSDEDVTLDIRFLAPTAGLEGEFLPADDVAKPCLAVRTRAQDTMFLSVLVPQKGGTPQLDAKRVEGGNCTAVAVTGPFGEDMVAVAREPGSMRFGPVGADGTSVLVRTAEGEPRSAMLTRGRALSLDGKPLLGCTTEANLYWERSDGLVSVEVEAPYRTEVGTVELSVGGLEPGVTYGVSLDGGWPSRVTADAEGTVKVTAELTNRLRLTVEK